MAKVLNQRHIEGRGVYVGRPSKWGNPFVVGKGYEQGEAAAAYKGYLWQNGELLASLGELFGQDLTCWCAPKPCHADHLLAAAEWARTNSPAWFARCRELGTEAQAVESWVQSTKRNQQDAS